MSTITVNALMDNIRVRLPGVNDDAAKLEMYNTIDQLCRDALLQPAPTNVDAAPETWLDTSLWVPNYQCILNGTLARLYMQAGKPWFSADLAKAHFDLYTFQLDQARGESAATTTVYIRVLSSIRAQLPMVRDAQIKPALYTTCDKIRKEALRLAPLNDASTDPTLWLPTANWDECYQAVVYGTLFRLLVQVGKPWSNPELAKPYVAAFDAEIDLLRGENAATSASIYDRIVNNVWVDCVGSRPETIANEIFTVVNKIRVEALRLATLTVTEDLPTEWLTVQQYTDAYQAILHGTLFRMRMQAGKPYFSAELAQASLAAFEAEMDLLRVEDAGTPASIYERLVDNIRVRCPAARDAAIKLEIFNAANRLRAEALELPPLQDSDTTPASWIPAAQYDDSYNALLNGALFEMYIAAGKSYFNPDLAKAHLVRFDEEVDRLRGETSPTTVYTKLIAHLRLELPMARTKAIEDELFGVCNKIRTEALKLAPLVDADTTPSLYLPAANWDEAYLAVKAGVLYRMQMQAGKPYANAELAKANFATFVGELDLLRVDNSSTPSTVFNRIVDNIRIRCPNARDGAINQAIFDAANKLRAEVLELAPLQDANTTPNQYLPTANWDECYLAMVHGTLFHLHLSAGKPYFNPELAQQDLAAFQQEVDLLRSEPLITPAAVYNRLIDTLRTNLPMARTNAIKNELYVIVNKLRAEALELAPLADADTTWTAWLPAGTWDDAYPALLHGTLYKMQMQIGKPYANLELAQANFNTFVQEMDLLRGETASNPTTVYNRLIDALRINVVLARTGVIEAELYHTADQIRREALRLPLLVDADNLPAEWIPADKWSQCYPALFHGTLSRLLLEYQKPYYNPDLAKIHAARFDAELSTLRSENVNPSDDVTRLMDNARTQLPGARDETILLELYNAIEDFLDQTNVWQEEITVTVSPDRTSYDIVPVGVSAIVRLMGVKDAGGYPVRATMFEPGVMVLDSAVETTQTFTATVALTCADPVDRDGYPEVPNWIWERYSGAFLAGVLGRMMTQIAKPYSAMALGVSHMRAFEGAVSTARVAQNRANLYGAQRWRFPSSFSTRRH